MSLRQKISRKIRRAYRLWQWRSSLLEIQKISRIGQNRRAFLLGNGPSLKLLDLSQLTGEFVCVVNTGLRALDNLLPHADMHVVNDIHCYRTFGREIEDIAARHDIPHRFLNQRMRSRWRLIDRGGARPIFLIVNLKKLTPSEPVPSLDHGIVTGPSVLLSAAVLLKFLGFKEIYVLGCDLDYGTAGAYFYTLDDRDKRHELQPDVIDRRKEMANTDAAFGILREDFCKTGIRLINAGIGGNLNALERVDFDSLFKSASTAMGPEDKGRLKDPPLS